MEEYFLLTDELEKQKEAIENLFGKVDVLADKPTPMEITDGIKSIPIPDLSEATATEADVAQGKTFYSGSSVLKTGSATFDTEASDAIFMAPEETVTYDGQLYYAFPSNIKKIRKYCFYRNFNSIEFSFDNSLETIDDYAFYKCKNSTFVNFNDLPKIKSLGLYSFAYSGAVGINVGRLPDTITNIAGYSFFEFVGEYLDFKFPDNLKVLGQYIYMVNTRRVQNSLDLTNFNLSSLQSYTFHGHAFNCDLIVPECVTNIGMYFNYMGSFRNVEIPANFTTLGGYSFNATSAQPLSDFYLKTFTFNCETPPSFGNNCFASQHVENGFKIYVPDNSVEAYKAISGLSRVVDCIYPMSEKP